MNEQLFSPLIEQAIELASEWHAGTYRKGRWRPRSFEVPAMDPANGALKKSEHIPGVPMMAHVTNVAMVVQRAGWEEPVVAAAFLHDLLEDPNSFGQRMSHVRFAELMGNEVATLVATVTEPKWSRDGVPLPWAFRKNAYVEQVAKGPSGAAAISLADKLHNAWSMAQSLEAGIDIFTDGPGRRALSAGPAEQRQFFSAVLDATEQHADERLVPLRTRLREEVIRFSDAARLDIV